MAPIKAIETDYAGHRFRSRLEARWALLFDALGVRWEYEPEAFTFELDGESVSYSPDFWLPEMRAWFEVKPDRSSLSDEAGGDAIAKAWGLQYAIKAPVFVGFGLKDAFIGIVGVDDEGEAYVEDVYWERCGTCQRWMLSPAGFKVLLCNHPSRLGWEDVLQEYVAQAAAHRFWNPKK